MEDRNLHRVTEVAVLLNVSRSKVYELLASGDLPSVKIDRTRLVRGSDLRDYVESLRPVAQAVAFCPPLRAHGWIKLLWPRPGIARSGARACVYVARLRQARRPPDAFGNAERLLGLPPSERVLRPDGGTAADGVRSRARSAEMTPEPAPDLTAGSDRRDDGFPKVTVRVGERSGVAPGLLIGT